MSALVFLDTETTGLSLDDDIWEFAAVRREDGEERELHLFIEHNHAKCGRLPDAFRTDHDARFPSACSGRVTTRAQACREITEFIGIDKAHIVGAVPNFDTERLLLMFKVEWPNWPDRPFWHHHLIDVENLAVGYLAGRAEHEGYTPIALPWDSNELSRQVGVEPEQFERHTAMGDVRWAMAIYDAITDPAVTAEVGER